MFKQSQLSGRTIHIYITRGTHTHTRGFDRELYCGVVVCMYVWELESGRESWSQLRKGYLCPLYFCNVRVFRYLTANVLYSFSVWLYALKDSQSGFSETQPPHNIFYQLLYSRTQSINTPDKKWPQALQSPSPLPSSPSKPLPNPHHQHLHLFVAVADPPCIVTPSPSSCWPALYKPLGGHLSGLPCSPFKTTSPSKPFIFIMVSAVFWNVLWSSPLTKAKEY